jgi:hypothetical protein
MILAFSRQCFRQSSRARSQSTRNSTPDRSKGLRSTQPSSSVPRTSWDRRRAGRDFVKIRGEVLIEHAWYPPKISQNGNTLPAPRKAICPPNRSVVIPPGKYAARYESSAPTYSSLALQLSGYTDGSQPVRSLRGVCRLLNESTEWGSALGQTRPD